MAGSILKGDCTRCTPELSSKLRSCWRWKKHATEAQTYSNPYATPKKLGREGQTERRKNGGRGMRVGVLASGAGEQASPK